MNYGQNEWVEKGWILDLEDIEDQYRPEQSDFRFFRVRRQQVTNKRPLTFGETIPDGNDLDASTTPSGDTLQPDSRTMVYQCAVGLKNDFEFWMEHPADHSLRQLDNELPQDNYDVGVVRQEESPYLEPNLDETEFWVIKDVADSPTFHAHKASGTTPVDPTISLRVNKLMLEPVVNENVADRLAAGAMTSTPVNLRVKSEV